MPIRITGMNSGLDTESIISELVKAKSVKKDNLVKAQTKLQWKQDAWKELNKKVYGLYSKTLSNMRLEGDYLKKTTKVSNSNAATVITGAKAVNGVQTLKIDSLATSGYLTGAQLKGDSAYTGETKLTQMGITESSVSITVGGKTSEIAITGETTINDFVSELKKSGVNANFDEKNQRFFISSKATGKDNDFVLSAKDESGLNALKSLGIAASLNEDANAKAYYASYCNEPVDGKYTAKTITADDENVKAAVEEKVAAYQSEYDSLLKSMEDNRKAQEEIKTKYNDSLPDKSALETRIKELEEKTDSLTEEDVKELEEAKTKLADVIRFDELESKNTELAKRQAEIEADCDVTDGKLTAASNLTDKVVAEEQAKADFAANRLNNDATYASAGATRIAGEDAKITLNGAEFTSDKNTFEINGLTITANQVTAEEFTITTADDTDGIYDMIKGFFKEYNELINEMDKLYNAASSKGYEPLTDEEKDAMSEKEVEKWEEKIKDSLLRRDSTLNNVASAMKEVMMQGIAMGEDGKKMYLSDFGIGTLGYFTAAENEKNAYHIDGDPDDTSTSTNADKLKTAIANDPDTVVKFFTTLSKNLYEKLGDLMKKTDYSSSFTLYDDVAMKEDYDDYKEKIAAQEEKIKNYEDRYYKKFSAMETALAKLTSKESALSGLFGGN